MHAIIAVAVRVVILHADGAAILRTEENVIGRS
ncbi:MAG: hypothetical protein QOJ59_3238, partial [Thermomicrobiales bacterium]|nr:hypothetical protein [Thermomicrobiales bacterium]